MTIQTAEQRETEVAARQRRVEMRPEIGKRLKAWRIAAEVSQIRAASAAGITLASLSNYETGKRDPAWTVVTLLQEFYAGLKVAS